MSEETERLAREAEARRNHVDDTLGLLRDKFSVGQIVDELSGYVREGQGADMVRNLNRQVRDNPLALGLVGAGIAWLLVGQGVRSEGSRLKGRYDDWREEDDPDDRDRLAGGGYPIADGRPHTVGEGPYGRGSSAERGSAGASDGPGLTDRAKGATAGVGSAVSSAASSAAGTASALGAGLADTARSVGSGVSGAAGSAGETVGHAMHDARDAATRTGESLYRGGTAAGRRVGGYGRRARRSFLDTLQEEPLIVGALALAIGAAVGAALPATRREDELMGETRDRLRDDALDYGREAVNKAEHVAAEAYRAGSEEADAKGLKPEGRDGETLAQKAASVVERAGEAARDTARKEGLG